mgnify:CR=1 FL=1
MRLAYGVGGIPEVWHRSPCLLPLFPFFLCSMLIHVLLLSKRHDVIHAQWLNTGLLSLPAAMLSGKPLVVTLRGSDLKKVHPRILDHLALDAAARARAWLRGNDFVSPEDIQAVAPACLAHRIHLSYEAEAEGKASEDIIRMVLDTVPVP